MGDDLAQREFLDQIERVSDFLYYGQPRAPARCWTRRGLPIWTRSRDGQADLAVSTFGLYTVNNLRREEVDALVNRVCQAVAGKWIGSGSAAFGNSATLRYRAAAEIEVARATGGPGRTIAADLARIRSSYAN